MGEHGYENNVLTTSIYQCLIKLLKQATSLIVIEIYKLLHRSSVDERSVAHVVQ